MVISLIFIILRILVAVLTEIYLKNQKKPKDLTNKTNIPATNEISKKDEKKYKNSLIRIFDVKIKDAIIKDGNRYSMILALGSIDYNMLSNQEQEGIENVLIQTALTIDYPIQFFITTEYIDTTAIINEITKHKDSNNNIAIYRQYMIEYLTNLMENRNISIRKNYAVISYYSDDLETAINELERKCNSLRANLSRAKIQSYILNENELYELMFREFNKNTKWKFLHEQKGGNLYVTNKQKR